LGESSEATASGALVQATSGQHRRVSEVAPVPGERHRPEHTTPCRRVQQHAAAFVEQAEAEAGVGLPQFVNDEFDTCIECGIPAHGFPRPGHAAWGLVLQEGPGSSDSAKPTRAPTLAPSGPADPPLEHTMLHYALVFFVIAVIAALLGFGGIAAGAAGIAKLLALVFIVLALVSLAADLLRGRR
jgi:uncharacterized membrane protein YtjA (UPF0391 family)